MPAVFQASCASCAYRTAEFVAGYAGILLGPADSSAASLVSPQVPSYRSTDGEDEQFVILAHPSESSIQARTGYTDWDLLREGRLVRATVLLCDDCGTLQHRHALAAPSAIGCLPALALGIASGVLTGILSRKLVVGAFATLFCPLLLFLVAERATHFFTRLRFRTRTRILSSRPHCTSCGSSRLLHASTAHTFPCPICSRRELRARMIGIS